jgi:hypothetical protein
MSFMDVSPFGPGSWIGHIKPARSAIQPENKSKSGQRVLATFQDGVHRHRRSAAPVDSEIAISRPRQA